jgi:hypothetical protein
MASLFEKLKHPQAPYYILLSLFLLHVLVMWPGGMTPDSYYQYNMAINNSYTGHHPPMMSVIWHYLQMVYPGSGLILLFHLSMFYAAICIFTSTFKDQISKFFYVFLPIVPPVLVYSSMIWKDVGFAFSYLLLAGILTHLTYLKKPLSLLLSIGVVLILFYGIAVKFQAQYCAPIIVMWIAYIWNNRKFNLITWVSGLVLNLIFFVLLNSFNSHFVAETQKSHSWQFVKIYDLAAISYEMDQPLFPPFTKTSHFNMQELREKFNSQRVDDLAFGEDAILQIGQNAEQRQELWNYWFQTILKHPFSYLKHRSYNLAYVLLSVPIGHIKKLSTILESKTNLNPKHFELTRKIFMIIYRIFATILIAHLPIILLGIFYILLAIRALPYHKAAVPLLFINLISLDMVIMLFFFSMAGTPRYTYISICLTHASHALAFLCWKALSQNRQAARTF